MSLVGIYPGQFYLHRVMPPHMVSAAAHRQAMKMGLSNAVIAMPVDGKRPPMDARAGMAFMRAPFEASPIVCVRKIGNWADAAADMFSGRDLYDPIPHSPPNLAEQQRTEKVNNFFIKDLHTAPAQ